MVTTTTDLTGIIDLMKRAMTAPPAPNLDFRSNGACSDADTDLFFPPRGEQSPEAMALCRSCPVTDECLDWALRHEHHGIWGGMSERQRIQLRRKRGLSRVLSPQNIPQPLCGTNAGYTAHLRNRDRPCVSCKQAHATFNQESDSYASGWARSQAAKRGMSA